MDRPSAENLDGIPPNPLYATIMRRTLFVAGSILAVAGAAASVACLAADEALTQSTAPQKMRVYIGTRGPDAKGIYKFDFDPATGKPGKAELATEAAGPSFVALHPSGKFLLAGERDGTFDGEKLDMISAFAIDPYTGQLTLVNRQPARGVGPCQISFDRNGKLVLAANYTSGSVVVLPLGADGRLSPATAFVQHEGSSVKKPQQEGPHAHSINVDPGNRFAIAADLGIDKLLVYRLDADKGTLAIHDPPGIDLPPGSGPRHLIFHPNGKIAYVINELSSTITALKWDGGKGTLTEIQTASTLPEGTSVTNATAEVQVHPNGKFLYGSNRGHDSIAIFAIDPATGRLTPLGHQSSVGKTPRNFGIDPSGAWLLVANQNSGTVNVFRIDRQTGMLEPTGEFVEVPTPTCVKFLPPAN